MSINIKTDRMRAAILFHKSVLFTPERIPDNDVPDGMHGAKPLQDAEAQFIYDLAQLLFERGRVQLLGSPGPPAGVELASGAPEVDADVTNGALLRVLLRERA